MRNAATDNVVCISCGADVRSEALFCYNCGGAVALGNASSKTDIAESITNKAENVATAAVEKAAAENSTTAPVDNAAAELPASPTEVVSKGKAVAKGEGKPLTSAMLRRKRAYNRQPVEVVWQEPENRSPVFVMASAVLTIIAALILAAALYLK